MESIHNLYVYNKDTSVIGTLCSAPLVFILKWWNCPANRLPLYSLQRACNTSTGVTVSHEKLYVYKLGLKFLVLNFTNQFDFYFPLFQIIIMTMSMSDIHVHVKENRNQTCKILNQKSLTLPLNFCGVDKYSDCVLHVLQKANAVSGNLFSLSRCYLFT